MDVFVSVSAQLIPHKNQVKPQTSSVICQCLRWSPWDSPYKLMGKNSLQNKIAAWQCALLLEPRHEITFENLTHFQT